MRRRLLTIAVLGLIGAAVSLGTAWGCIFWRVFVAKQYLGAAEGTVIPGLTPRHWRADWPAPDQVDVTVSLGYRRQVSTQRTIEYQDSAPVPAPLKLPALTTRPGFSGDPADAAAMEEVRQNVQLRLLIELHRSTPRRVEDRSTFWRGSGWPLFCMRSSWAEHSIMDFGATNNVMQQSADPDASLTGEGWTPRMYYERGWPWPTRVLMPDGTSLGFNLPLRPIWSGFLLNSAFWASAAWLAWRGLVAMRRHRRHDAGCCTQCGYPIGVSAVCTECGRPVPAGHGLRGPAASHPQR